MSKQVVLVLALVLGVMLGALLFAPHGLLAAMGCWGSICQDTNGGVYLSQSVTSTSLLSLSSVPGAQSTPGFHVFACSRGPLVPPGFAGVAIGGRPGSAPGTTKVVLIAGQSQTETTLVDNLPGGGC